MAWARCTLSNSRWNGNSSVQLESVAFFRRLVEVARRDLECGSLLPLCGMAQLAARGLAETGVGHQ
jgi:hypothetical protein